VELGVRVREDVQNRHEIHHLSISGQYLVIHEYQIISTTYTLENTTTRPLTITIEAPLLAHYELHETRAADAETLNERRWKVAAPPRAKTRFERKERTLVSRHEQLRNLNYDRLSAYLRDNLLDQRTYERLHDLLDQQNRIAQAQREIQRLENERKQHYTMQEQARANLGSLSASGKEAALRDRVLKQLENAQDRIEAIEREIEAHKSRITQAEQAIEAILKALN
jgi:chromosome segregation ATPase